MKFEAYVTYPDGKVKRVKNLGYMLRNWSSIEDIHVMDFVSEQDDNTRPRFVDAFMSVDFTDGRNYTTGFMDKGILCRFLDRPVFRGLTVNWYGEDIVIEKGFGNG